MQPNRARQRFGFTLLEIVLAMSITALVVLAAREISERLTTTGRALHRATISAGRRTAGNALLRSLVGQIDVGRDSVMERSALFGGTESWAEFLSWCQRGNWEEHCSVHLQLVPSASGVVILRANISSIGVVDLDSFPTPVAFRYLLDASNSGRWMNRWSPGPFAPLAIGIVTATDTTILPAGPHG